MDLPPQIALELDQICEQARAFEDSGQFEQAVAVFAAALQLLPPPTDAWEASSWLRISIGDCYFHLGQWLAAYTSLRLAIVEGEHIDNPFLRLRRGQCLLELGNEAKALEELAAAYMLEGSDIFVGENPKYFAFVKERLPAPRGGQW